MQERMDGTEVKQAASRGAKARLEGLFLAAWRFGFSDLPMPTMQHKFHPRRKWRFDFSWPAQKLAVELQGGSFIGGGHNRPVQQQKDYEKQRAAVALGWRVLPFNTIDMKDPDFVAQQVAEVLTNAKEIA